MQIDELKKLLAIDKANLDDEVARQPMLFYEIAEKCEEASAQADTLKEHLASVDAGLDGEIRQDLDGEKYTEAMVKNQIILDKAHVEAYKQYLSAKTTAGKLTALKDAFKQRGYMLRDLASLYSASYFEQSSIQADRARYEDRRRILAEARSSKDA